MKTPKRIQPLVDDGLVDEVVRRLKSGKEADVFVVRSGSEIRCAKVYKEASQRSFKQAVQYQEGILACVEDRTDVRWPKSRDGGASWCVLATMLWLCLFKKNQVF